MVERWPATDLAVSLVRDGYRALPLARRRHGGAGAFDARMLGRRATVVRGPEGARLLYDRDLVRRRGAVPFPVRALLFGSGGVQGLDGRRHEERKRVFLDLLSAEAVDTIAAEVAAGLDHELADGPGTVRLADVLVRVYGRAVLAWAGTGCAGAQADRTSRELARLVDGFGGAGAAYVRGWLARVRLNRWAARLVEDVRAGRRAAPAGSPLDVLASVIEDGERLPAEVAAVELVNLLRPTVAVAWPGCDLARALVEHPQWRDRVGPGGDDDQREAFVHEVRRLYPLTPALAGKVRSTTRRGGHSLRRGQRVVLDVPATNRDPATWGDPDTFRPERFLDRMPDEWEFVPQGGGAADRGHRCPGEPLTVRLLLETLPRLADRAYVLSPGRTQGEQECARRIPPRADEVLRTVAGPPS